MKEEEYLKALGTEFLVNDQVFSALNISINWYTSTETAAAFGKVLSSMKDGSYNSNIILHPTFMQILNTAKNTYIESPHGKLTILQHSKHSTPTGFVNSTFFTTDSRESDSSIEEVRWMTAMNNGTSQAIIPPTKFKKTNQIDLVRAKTKRRSVSNEQNCKDASSARTNKAHFNQAKLTKPDLKPIRTAHTNLFAHFGLPLGENHPQREETAMYLKKKLIRRKRITISNIPNDFIIQQSP